MNDNTIVRDAINAFYKSAGLDINHTGDINERVAHVFGQMLNDTKKCSDAFRWVPRPSGGPASIAWVASNFKRGIISKLNGTQSFTCARAVILKYKSKMAMASMGV